ncbi:MAG: hypothetical protein HYX51_03665 [Chloroflexi bacterium]|nr:hypothetical protein [Chloroflexota bacterium]
MDVLIRRRVVIEPGGRVTVQSDELPDGAEADVIVRVPSDRASHTYESMFGSGRGVFATPEDADAFVRHERDAWKD